MALFEPLRTCHGAQNVQIIKTPPIAAQKICTKLIPHHENKVMSGILPIDASSPLFSHHRAMIDIFDELRGFLVRAHFEYHHGYGCEAKCDQSWPFSVILGMTIGGLFMRGGAVRI
jgi:hypothetical protein